MKTHRRVIILACLLSLTGCGDPDSMRRKFGFTRDAPDEFQVTTRAPLAMPPTYALRAPRPGVNRPQELSLSRQAEAVLVPEEVLVNDSAPSAGEEAVMVQAGPKPPHDIRAEVDRESDQAQPSQGVVSNLMFWQGTQRAGVVVDPQQEAARLKQTTAQAPASQPSVPQASASHSSAPEPQSSSGLFDWLF